MRTKNIAGKVVHRNQVKQERFDEDLDRGFEKRPWGETVPSPKVLSDGSRRWTFD